MKIVLSQFAERQLAPDYDGFRINEEQLQKLLEMSQNPVEVFPGYADFCQILALSNRKEDGDFVFADFKCQTVGKEQALAEGGRIKTAYEARTPEELPVLVEWVEGVLAPPAEFIHLILYSAEQMEKEGEEVPEGADWLIVSIGTGASREVEPMRPITAMRNALGIEFGGSGVPVDREEYLRSAAYWQEYIAIRESQG